MLKNVLYHWDSSAVDSFIPLSSPTCASGKKSNNIITFIFITQIFVLEPGEEK